MDIFARLRKFESVKDYWGDWEIAKEAADEIERLREELDRQIAWKNYAIDSGIILADAVIHARQNGYVLPAWLHNAAINPLDLFLEEKKRRTALKEGE
jgi:2-polyprenyl-3-methyl-5-hydroxy-6-metoxy-1,4-benzoquinol methylase